MRETAWYLGALVIVLLTIVLLLWSVLLWIGIGLAVLVLLVIGWSVWGLVHRRHIQHRLDLATAQEAEAKAAAAQVLVEQQQALAEQYRAHAAALWNQQFMIPNTMVGLVLNNSTDRERVMTWAQPRKLIVQQATPALPAAAEESRLPLRAPIFGLAERDMVGTQLLLGYNAEGRPLLAPDKALRSGIIVLGRPGEGKSTIGRYWTALSLKYRFPVMVIDPHESILGELASRFYTEREGITAATMAADIAWILDHRIRLGEKYLHKFLLIIVDEWAYYQRSCPALVEALGRVILEGRKFRLCVQILGHGFPADSLGGSTIRDAVSSLYILGSSPAQARLAGLESNAETAVLLQQVKLAGPGSAILSLMGIQPTFCSIPDTTEADLARLLEGLHGHQAIAIPDVAARSTDERAQLHAGEGVPPDSPSAPERPETPVFPLAHIGGKPKPLVTAEERAVILRYAEQGMPPHGIARAMRHAHSFADVVRLVLAEEEIPRETSADGTDGN